MSVEVIIQEVKAAIMRGGMEAMDRVLASGVSPNSEFVGPCGEAAGPLLYLAALVSLSLKRKIRSLLVCFFFFFCFVFKYDQKDVAALLIDRGAEVDKASGDECAVTPLLIAASVCF